MVSLIHLPWAYNSINQLILLDEDVSILIDPDLYFDGAEYKVQESKMIRPTGRSATEIVYFAEISSELRQFLGFNKEECIDDTYFTQSHITIPKMDGIYPMAHQLVCLPSGDKGLSIEPQNHAFSRGINVK